MTLGFPEHNLILFRECGALETLLVLAVRFDLPSRDDYYPSYCLLFVFVFSEQF